MAHSIRRRANDYATLRTIPAVLGIVFALTSLYQFGGISEVHLTWLDYTLETETAMFASLGVLLVAFASSETRDYQYYDTWEMAIIAAGPILIVTHQYVPEVADVIAQNDPIGGALAFSITVAAWGAAVR